MAIEALPPTIVLPASHPTMSRNRRRSTWLLGARSPVGSHWAEVNSRDVTGDTPLHKSAHRAILNPAMVRLLLAHRAEVSPRNVHGDTPLTYPKGPRYCYGAYFPKS